MLNNNTPRLIIIIVALLWGVYSLIPTIKFNSLTDEDKLLMDENGTLESLEKNTIRQGLDLQGGMHIVLEVDIPTLLENLASNKNDRFYNVFNEIKDQDEFSADDFISRFILEAQAQELRLNRYFMDYGNDPASIELAIEEEATDAIDRALEILQNRVDEFGVSEPTIQKQGNRRIIVELAGIEDPERARSLLQSTALLEFSLLKDGAITQSLLARIDRVLKGNDELNEIIESKENNSQESDVRTTEQEEVSLTELFVTSDTDTSSEDSSEVLVDKDLFQDRPFSSLLRQVGNDLGVPEQNLHAIKKVLQNEEVQNILDTGGGILNAIDYFSDDPFLVINPDTIWGPKYIKELKLMEDNFFSSKENKCSMLVVDKLRSFDKNLKGDFNLEKNLIKRKSDCDLKYIYTGLQIIKPEIFSDINEKVYSIIRINRGSRP